MCKKCNTSCGGKCNKHVAESVDLSLLSLISFSLLAMAPFNDISKLRADPSMLPPKKRRSRKRLFGWFVKGPISGEWISRAAKLPGKSLHVALAIQYSLGVYGEPVVLANDLAERFGINRRQTVFKALRNLEAAGLIQVDRSRGRCPRVVVVQVKQPVSER